MVGIIDGNNARRISYPAPQKVKIMFIMDSNVIRRKYGNNSFEDEVSEPRSCNLNLGSKLLMDGHYVL